jgi:DNA repair protein RadC
MAKVNTAPTRTRTTKPRAKVCEALSAYGVSDGALSFRHGLHARERSAIDKALQIVGRYLQEPGVALAGPWAVSEYLRLQLAAEPREVFAVLYLNAQHEAIAFEHLFTGTLTQTSVHPREVLRAAIAHNAAAVVLAHNHPSGNLTPSKADVNLTQAIKTALSWIDVRVLDHVIVAGNGSLSMAEKGML